MQCESVADSLLSSLYPDVLIQTRLDAVNYHPWSYNVPQRAVALVCLVAANGLHSSRPRADFVHCLAQSRFTCHSQSSSSAHPEALLESPSSTKSRLKLHTRPPRQWLPSSLLIESTSAPASVRQSAFSAEALPIKANDKGGSIRLHGHQ
jgi:hypothetical protein